MPESENEGVSYSSAPYQSPPDVDSSSSAISLGKTWIWVIPVAVISGILGLVFFSQTDTSESTGTVELIESIENFGGDRRFEVPDELELADE